MTHVIKNSLELTSSQEIKEICKPLFELFGVNFFRYLRVYKDGSRVNLCTDPIWTDHFYTNKFYNIAWLDYAMPSQIKKAEIIWDDRATRDDNQVGVDARNSFNIFHGMSIVRPGAGYYEVFDFATERSNAKINETYLSNMDLFEKFFFYFRDKAYSLINIANKKRIRLPDLNQRNDNLIVERLNQDSVSKFLAQTEINRYFLGSQFNENVYLTKKEAECIYWTILGKSADDIACILGSSKRTVECHLENAKNKMGCIKVVQLVKLAVDGGLLEVFNNRIKNHNN